LHSASRVVHAIARAEMNAHFAHAFAHRFAIAEVTKRCCIQPGQDARLALEVPQLPQPMQRILQCGSGCSFLGYCIYLDTIKQAEKGRQRGASVLYWLRFILD